MTCSLQMSKHSLCCTLSIHASAIPLGPDCISLEALGLQESLPLCSSHLRVYMQSFKVWV